MRTRHLSIFTYKNPIKITYMQIWYFEYAAHWAQNLTPVSFTSSLQAVAKGSGGHSLCSSRTSPPPDARKSTFPPTVRALTSWTSSVYEIELIKSSSYLVDIFELWPQLPQVTSSIIINLKNRGFTKTDTGRSNFQTVTVTITRTFLMRRLQ